MAAKESDYKKREDAGQAPSDESPPAWEWFAAAIGLALLLASLGYLLYDATLQNHAASPAIRVVGIEPQDGRYLVRLEVFNQSRSTVAALRISGELKRGAEVVESSDMELPYVPGRSSREGGLFFQQDPRTLQLVLSARSYQVP